MTAFVRFILWGLCAPALQITSSMTYDKSIRCAFLS